RFIHMLRENGEGDWVVTDEEVTVDDNNRNYDYELSSQGKKPIALELVRLVDSEEQVAQHKLWATVANQIAAELRARGIKGYTVQTAERFQVRKNHIAEHVKHAADEIEEAIQSNPHKSEIETSNFEIARIDGFNDVNLYSIGGGHAIN